MSEQLPHDAPDPPVSAGPDTWPLSAREAATLLGVNERTIRRAIARGEIHAAKRAGAFRISPDELDRYRSRQGTPGIARLAPRTIAPPLTLLPSTPMPQAAPLPRPLTSFVGRESEVEATRSRIDDESVRLVTLTGPGGVGKTRLAIEVARTTRVFPDGVHFVDLASVRDAGRVGSAIAQALGLRSRPQRSLADRLAPALSGRKALLVLDNFEHVIAAAPLVPDLLTAFPGLTILVTSRSRLRVSGEHEIIVPPLQVDPPGLETGTGTPGMSDAARLFMARAGGSSASLSSAPSTVATVERICQQLDGLPLAIELAAVRLNVLSPELLLERLRRRIPLLTGGSRDLPSRHQTIRATIGWSYNLLTPTAQALFRRLSVFTGGVSLMAAEEWARSNIAGDMDPLDAITELVDASLLRNVGSPNGYPRFHMLETVREYGQELLEQHGETRAARDAHAAFFVGLNEWLEPNVNGPGTSLDDRLREIDPEQPNIAAALQHLADIGDVQGALHLAANCAVAWHHLGYLSEGRYWLDHALAHAAPDPTVDRGMALVGLALIRWTQVDHTLGSSEADEALTIGRMAGNTRLVALALHMLALIEQLHERHATAWEQGREATSVWREIGERSSEGMALLIQSEASFAQGDVETSRRLTDEALDIFRSIGHSPGQAFCALGHARLAMIRGQDRDALRLFQDALRLLVDARERWAISKALIGVASLAARSGQDDVAATLLGAIDARIEEAGSGIFPQDRDLYDQTSAQIQTALGEERYTELHASGHRIAVPDIVDMACSVTAPASHRGERNPDALSSRERDVLRLLVDGRSNAEIAEELFITVRTVRAHVASILAKLGLPTRTAAATYAIRHNLT